MNKHYFIEDLRSSSEEEDIGHNARHWDIWTRNRPSQNDSPPAMLAFSITSGRGKHGDQSPEPGPSCHIDADGGVQEESNDGSVEEWMILDQVSEDGDSTIQLNLSYSNTSSEEDTDDENTLREDSWAVSIKDKESVEVLSVCRYFMPRQSLICPICKKTGHLAKSCQVQRKSPVCVLCGIPGHLQKECPSRPCSRCGLLAHGARVCDRPPVWYQHCQRCGIMGHLSDICPDTWRQFHHTTKMTEVPIKRWTYQTMKQKKRHAHCYNCSERGHYGYECRLKRMISGTFFTLPFVCHYDEVHHIDSKTQNRNMDITNKSQPLAEQPQCFKSFGEEKDQLLQRRNKMKQKVQASMRKTWPERRRQRQELKRLRREAQARREGGVLGQYKPDGDMLHLDRFAVSNPWQHQHPLKKTNKIVLGNRRSKKSRDSEQWKKRGGKKHGLIYSHKEIDIGTENVPSPKERVRHRRR